MSAIAEARARARSVSARIKGLSKTIKDARRDRFVGTYRIGYVMHVVVEEDLWRMWKTGKRQSGRGRGVVYYQSLKDWAWGVLGMKLRTGRVYAANYRRLTSLGVSEGSRLFELCCTAGTYKVDMCLRIANGDRREFSRWIKRVCCESLSLAAMDDLVRPARLPEVRDDAQPRQAAKDAPPPRDPPWCEVDGHLAAAHDAAAKCDTAALQHHLAHLTLAVATIAVAKDS